MSKRKLGFILLFSFIFLSATGIPTNSQNSGQNGDENQTLISGRNVNMVSGITLPGGDPWLQRQNEPSIAVSTRNPLHLLAGANDYRTVDMPIEGEQLPGLENVVAAGDAWLGVFKSLDGGQSWTSTLLPGFPQDNSFSPLKGYAAAADPVVRAGTNGLFYYSGIAFERKDYGRSAVFVARYIDNNNSENNDPIKYIDTHIIDKGKFIKFIDKPWMAADIPRGKFGKVKIDGQRIPRANVYIAYTAFYGFEEKKISKIHFARSVNCGKSWGIPRVLDIAWDFGYDKNDYYNEYRRFRKRGRGVNQGATVAVDPRNGTVYVAWRRFGMGKRPDAIFVARSTNRGFKFQRPVKVAEITPFDQGTTNISFRTNSYPTLTVDDKGIVYLAWAQRGEGPAGAARIVLATSTNGKHWTLPTPVNNTQLAASHQFMPSLTFATGKLTLVWYDQRNDFAAWHYGFGDWIADDLPHRHTIDVWAAQADPGRYPVFDTSTQVSRYLFHLEEYPAAPNGYRAYQVQFNPPNYPLFSSGTLPFLGDYLDVTPSPMFVVGHNGRWRFNTEPSDTTVFHVAWTDNRDVRPPGPPYDWSSYAPPTSEQAAEYISPGRDLCQGGQSPGMRNQNIYTSRITSGIEVGSPANYKPLDLDVPRAFVIFVKNTTGYIKSFRLSIAEQPPEGQASFLQFELLDTLDISIAPYSTISRQVFVDSLNPNDSVTIDIDEIDAPGGIILDDGLKSLILLNPDPTNPGGDGIEDEETHTPNIDNPNIENWFVNPNITNPNITNPNIDNPNIVNPNIVNPNIDNPNIDNPNITNPNITNPNITNPNIDNPNIDNPNIVNPNITNPNIENISPTESSVTDIEWVVTNDGNTTTSYTVKALAKDSLPDGLYAQLIIYRAHYTPAVDGSSTTGCTLKQEPHHELIANIINPNIDNPNIVNPNIDNPNIDNSSIENATISVAPGDEVHVTLRIIDPGPSEPSTGVRTSGTTRAFDLENFIDSLGFAVTSQSVDSKDAEQGIKTPPVAASILMITTSALPDGFLDKYYEATLSASGGDNNNYFWALNFGELPPGLSLSSGGMISGTPTTDGTYYFNIEVTDGTSEPDSQRFSITIYPGTTPEPLSITTISLPNGVKGNWYGATLEATGGIWPRSWSLESGSLPVGLSLNTGGVISGTPTTEETTSFRVKVVDAEGDFDTADLSLEILPFTGVDVTISGTIYNGAGGPPLEGVLIHGLPGPPITDSYGNYSATVPQGWTGTATPTKVGFSFSPESRAYVSISEDQDYQDYAATLLGVDHFEFNAISNQTAGLPFSITITAKDINGDTVTYYTGVNSLIDSTETISPASTGAFESGIWTGNVTILMAQTNVTITTSAGGKTGESNPFNVIVGAVNKIRIEDAADGTGIEVDTKTITQGGSFTVYAILRDIGDNFIDNTAGTWSLIEETGDVGGGDLVPAEDEKSATFTGHGEGTAKITVYYLSLNDETGTIEVTGTPPDDTYDIYPEDNDDFSSAAGITTGTFANLQLLDDDWYKIYVLENKVLKISITGVLGNDIDLGLADSAGKYLVGGISSSNEDTIYYNTTSSGDYYIRVPYTWGEGFQNTYTLTAEISDSFGQGQVFGRVTDNTYYPLHVRIRVYDQSGDWKWNTLTDATTGEYRISIPAGSYKIRFITYPIHDYYGGINYLSKYYGDKFRFVEAPLIEVLSGENLFSIDGQLELGGAITGTVTDLQGNAIEGALIRVRDLNGYSATSANSDEFGQYTIERLNTGYFKAFVRSWTENHGIEWYNDKPSFNEANAIYVETGQTASGIDFQLTEGGNVEGRVTDVNGGVGGIQVIAYDPSLTIPFLFPSTQIPRIGLRSTSTDDNGNYFMDHLPNGNVSLYFNTDNTNLVPEWYDDVLRFKDSVPVPIQAGQTTSGINVELAESGAVDGRVTNSSGDGIKNVLVWVFNLEGGGYYQKNAYTNDDGYYRIDRIPVGNVKVRFRPNIYTSPHTGNWAVEWYSNKNFYTEADELTVVANESTWGIDAELADNGGKIEGRIINSSGQGIGGVYVSAYDSSIQAQVSFVYTDANGYYSIPRIPTCDVKLAFFTGNNKLPYVSEFYNDLSSYEDATPVSVVLGQITTLQDVVLSDRPDLTVTTDTLPNGVVGTLYSQALVAEGGTKHYHWSLDSSSLPNGLYLMSNGVIEGTPTTQGTFDFTVKVVDTSFPPQEAFSQNLSITINPYTGTGFTISGNVTYEGSPLGGVFMEGLPNNTNTNASGGYIAIVSSGWSGTVTPTLPDYAFTPLYRSYDDVMTNQINQDYTASVGLTISGSVWLDGYGLPGVLMSGLPGNPTTDENGNYTATIPSGWSGTVTPSKNGHSFNPYNRSYVSATSNLLGQDYQATLITAEWVARYNGPAANSSDSAAAVATDSYGNIYVTGSSDGSGMADDYATIKYDSNGNQLWEARYKGQENGYDYGRAITVDSYGNVYVTGYSGYKQYDYATIKYNSNGDQVWVARYDGPGNNDDLAVAIAVDSYGNVYVTGYSYNSAGNYDYATIKYDSNGDQDWVARYDGPANGEDRPVDIAMDSYFNVYVTGRSYGDGTNYDYATIKYDSNGDQVWLTRYDATSPDRPTAIALDAAGNVYVTGQSYRSGTSYDYLTIKYDNAGDQAWITWYDNDSNSDYPQAIVLDSSGNVCVTGYCRVYTEGGSYYDYATVKYNSSGEEQWAATYDGPGSENDMAYAVDVDSSGNIYVTGRSLGSNEYNEYATIKYSSTGSELWIKRYDGSANGNDTASAIVVDSFGNIVVTGSSHGSSTNNDYATIKYDSDGGQLWEAIYNGPNNDENMNWVYGDIMAMDSLNNVYMSGYSYGNGTAYDYTTVKFTSDGDQAWAKRYNGPGNYADYAEDIAVDTDGNVYVTGAAYSGGRNPDYATVKYNSAGEEQWAAAATYDGPENGADWAYAIAVDTDGNVYVTGESLGTDTGSDCTTIKYNGDTGYQEWVARYNGPDNPNDEGWGITVDALGNVYVIGRTYKGSQAGRYDFLTIKYDSGGDELWVRTYDGPGNQNDYAYFIALDSSNNVYVCGHSYGNGSYDYATVKYNSAGDFQWVARYNGPGNGSDYPQHLVVDSDFNAYVTGRSPGNGTYYDFATVKYDSSGNELWVRRYEGESTGSYDYGSGIALDSSGNVYVTGRSGGTDTHYDGDCITIKYNSDGTPLWIKKYNGPGNGVDGSHVIYVTSSGDVYVAGMSVGIGTGYDFIVIKYRQ